MGALSPERTFSLDFFFFSSTEREFKHLSDTNYSTRRNGTQHRVNRAQHCSKSQSRFVTTCSELRHDIVTRRLSLPTFFGDIHSCPSSAPPRPSMFRILGNKWGKAPWNFFFNFPTPPDARISHSDPSRVRQAESRPASWHRPPPDQPEAPSPQENFKIILRNELW